MYVIRGPGGFGASEVVARPRRGRGDPAGLLRGLRPLAMTALIASGPAAPRNDYLVRGHHTDRLAGEQVAAPRAGFQGVLARRGEAHFHVVGLADSHRLSRHGG